MALKSRGQSRCESEFFLLSKIYHSKTNTVLTLPASSGAFQTLKTDHSYIFSSYPYLNKSLEQMGAVLSLTNVSQTGVNISLEGTIFSCIYTHTSEYPWHLWSVWHCLAINYSAYGFKICSLSKATV